MKKLTLLVVAVVVAALVYYLWPEQPIATPPPASSSPATQPQPSDPDTVPPSPSASPTPARTEGPYSSTAAAKKVWEPVAQGFALAYPDTAGLSRKEWLVNLRPYLAPDVMRALAETDLTKVPAGHYAGYQILKQADESLTLRVTYQEGWALVLYMVAVDDQTWRVNAFDEAEDFD